MPRTLSLDGLIAKNALEQDSPWLFLFDMTLLDGTELHFVNYPEGVLWNSVTYTPYYLRMDAIQESADGTIQGIKVRVSNVFREMEALMQTKSGLRGSAVTVRVVHKDDPSAGELVQGFVVTESSSNAVTAEFTLEKAVPALEVSIPGRSFNLADFPGIQDRTGYW